MRRSRVVRDARGAGLVEYLLLVGLVALVALGGYRAFGGGANGKATAQAACIQNLAGCNGAAPGAEATTTGVPTRSEVVDNAAQASTQGDGGGGSWWDTAKSWGGNVWSFGVGFVWDGLAKGLIWGTLEFAGNQLYLIATDPYQAYVGQWVDLGKGLWNAAVNYDKTWDAISTYVSSEWQKDPARLLGRGVFEVASLVVPWTKIGKAKAVQDVAELTRTVSATEKLVEGERVIDTLSDAEKAVQAQRALEAERALQAQRALDEAEAAKKASGILDETPALAFCFVAGTPVATSDGLRPIESIRPGDLVLSRDEWTGETSYRPVVQTFVKHATEIVRLELTSRDGTTEVLRTTPAHPFWVEGKGWVLAGELEPGLTASASDGRSLQVGSLAHVAADESVYNFEVEQFHTYFVGNTGVWVHNDCRAREIPYAQAVNVAQNVYDSSSGLRALAQAMREGQSGQQLANTVRQLQEGAKAKYGLELKFVDNATDVPKLDRWQPGARGNYGTWNEAEKTIYFRRELFNDPKQLLEEMSHEYGAFLLGQRYGGKGNIPIITEMKGVGYWQTHVLDDLVKNGGRR